MNNAPHLPLHARLAMLARLLVVQSSWNYETMMGNGIAFAMEPALRRLPGGRDGERYRAAVGRESRYFNAHPYLAGLAVGALARAELEGDTESRIERFRAACCGPLGSVGDWKDPARVTDDVPVGAGEEARSDVGRVVALGGSGLGREVGRLEPVAGVESEEELEAAEPARLVPRLVPRLLLRRARLLHGFAILREAGPEAQKRTGWRSGGARLTGGAQRGSAPPG